VERVTHKGKGSCSAHKIQHPANGKMGKVHRNILYLTISLGKALFYSCTKVFLCFGIRSAIIPTQKQLQVKCLIK